MATDWTPWLGLPHEVGADPRNGKAACCLVICSILLADAGYDVPDISPMLEHARQRNWTSLQRMFDEFCCVVDKAELYAITLLRNGPAGLGLGIVVEGNRLLFPHHKRGVIAAPIDQLRLMQYRKLRR